MVQKHRGVLSRFWLEPSKISILAQVVFCFFLGSCMPLEGLTSANQDVNVANFEPINQYPVIEKPRKKNYLENNNSEIRSLEQKAIRHLVELDFENSSKLINQALKLDIQSSRLQFLNGYIYHQMAMSGDKSLLDLAAEGYLLSIKFDPTNWLSYYQYGLLNLDKRNFKKAS